MGALQECPVPRRCDAGFNAGFNASLAFYWLAEHTKNHEPHWPVCAREFLADIALLRPLINAASTGSNVDAFKSSFLARCTCFGNHSPNDRGLVLHNFEALLGCSYSAPMLCRLRVKKKLTTPRSSKPPSPDSADAIVTEIEMNSAAHCPSTPASLSAPASPI
jgi:hypothetical protein